MTLKKGKRNTQSGKAERSFTHAHVAAQYLHRHSHHRHRTALHHFPAEKEKFGTEMV